LATGFGDSGTVGIGGLTLGGGVGFLTRKYGLTIDDLLAADIVTADGWLLRADAETHPDLFWAIRGGGGNFGVATRFKFQLHEVDKILGGILIMPATADIIRSFVAEAEDALEELSVIAGIMPAPPMPFVTKEHHGRLIIMAMMVYAGQIEAGQRVIAPSIKKRQRQSLRTFRPPPPRWPWRRFAFSAERWPACLRTLPHTHIASGES
jgi:FAD/FMN-containing dehydrogenase